MIKNHKIIYKGDSSWNVESTIQPHLLNPTNPHVEIASI